jgi:hypothetical protein
VHPRRLTTLTAAGNPNRGFDLMKNVEIGTSLSMTRAMRIGGDAARFGEKSHQNA